MGCGLSRGFCIEKKRNKKVKENKGDDESGHANEEDGSEGKPGKKEAVRKDISTSGSPESSIVRGDIDNLALSPSAGDANTPEFILTASRISAHLFRPNLDKVKVAANKRGVTASQIEFFRMLDDKIEKGYVPPSLMSQELNTQPGGENLSVELWELQNSSEQSFEDKKEKQGLDTWLEQATKEANASSSRSQRESLVSNVIEIDNPNDPNRPRQTITLQPALQPPFVIGTLEKTPPAIVLTEVESMTYSQQNSEEDIIAKAGKLPEDADSLGSSDSDPEDYLVEQNFHAQVSEDSISYKDRGSLGLIWNEGFSTNAMKMAHAQLAMLTVTSSFFHNSTNITSNDVKGGENAAEKDPAQRNAKTMLDFLLRDDTIEPLGSLDQNKKLALPKKKKKVSKGDKRGQPHVNQLTGTDVRTDGLVVISDSTVGGDSKPMSDSSDDEFMDLSQGSRPFSQVLKKVGQPDEGRASCKANEDLLKGTAKPEAVDFEVKESLVLQWLNDDTLPSSTTRAVNELSIIPDSDAMNLVPTTSGSPTINKTFGPRTNAYTTSSTSIDSGGKSHVLDNASDITLHKIKKRIQHRYANDEIISLDDNSIDGSMVTASVKVTRSGKHKRDMDNEMDTGPDSSDFGETPKGSKLESNISKPAGYDDTAEVKLEQVNVPEETKMDQKTVPSMLSEIEAVEKTKKRNNKTVMKTKIEGSVDVKGDENSVVSED